MAPSSSDKWIQCGFNGQTIAPPSPKSDASLRGDEIHDRVSELLSHDATPEPFEDAAWYVYEIRDELKKIPGGELYTEKKYFSTSLPDALFGTIDILIVSPETLYVIDIKTGKWPVAADWNSQLYNYLLIAVENFGIRPDLRGMILQNGKRSRLRVTPRALWDFRNLVLQQANSTEQVRGPWCTFCHRKVECQAHQDYLVQLKAEVWD